MRFRVPKTLVPALVAAAVLTLLPGPAQAQYSTPVRDIDQPARNHFRLNYSCAGMVCSTPGTVPAGYVFVIETILYRLFSPNAGVMPLIQLANNDDSFFLSPTFVAGNSSFGAHRLRLYTEIVPNIIPNATVNGSSNSYIQLWGHLVKK